MEILTPNQLNEFNCDSLFNTNDMALLKSVGNYFREIFQGVASLVRGMKVTGGYFIKPSTIVTQKYPENRDTLKMFDSFKGELQLIHDDNNQHSCNVCNT